MDFKLCDYSYNFIKSLDIPTFDSEIYSFEIDFFLFGKQLETVAMKFCAPVFANGIPMFYGRIAFIALPIIMWKFLMNLYHKFITMCFRQNGGCCNMKEFSIAFNHTCKRSFAVRLKSVAVYSNKIRRFR